MLIFGVWLWKEKVNKEGLDYLFVITTETSTKIWDDTQLYRTEVQHRHTWVG